MIEPHVDQLPGPTRKLSPATSYLARLAPGSRDTMARALRMITESLGHQDPREVPWEKVGYAETQAIAAAIREQYAPRTVNRILSALRGVLEEAWNLGLMDGDDYQRARRVRSSNVDTLPAGRQLSGAEIRALVSSCRDQTRKGARDLGLLALLLGAGLRRQEAIGLRVADLQDGSLRVVGKRRKERRAMFLQGALPMLEEWLDVRGRAPGPILYAVNKADRVLTRPVSLSGVNSVLAERGKVAGVGRFSPHDLRRTFASRLLSGGADLLAVQGLLGHASPTTTSSGYDRRGDEGLRKATENVSILDPTTVDGAPS